MIQYYEVHEFDGLGELRFNAEWNVDEVARHCAKFGQEFHPEGGGFQFDEYNAGTDSLPSWRSSGFDYDPID